MNLDVFLATLLVLDSNPPTFDASPARRDAFLKIGEFIENNTRAGAPFDLKTSPNPFWQAIETRLLQALDGIEAEPADAPPTAWQLYNDGVVLTADGLAIGMDVFPFPRRFGWTDSADLTGRLADLLDVLFITHRHPDHYDKALVRACLERGKPVVLPAPLAADWPGVKTVIAADDGLAFKVAGLDVTARRGFHVWRATMEDLPLVYYEIVCPGDFTFLFIGDLDVSKKLEKTAGRDIDLFFVPWRHPNETYEPGHAAQTGRTYDAVQAALDKVRPRALLFEHLAELEHVYDGFPASYDIAIDLKARVRVPSELLFWGERIAWPSHPR
ncbi:MAG TPA: MBL fold metallo-hydrolase [Kiritimatiellia bacterium]|nr:MBL fold metallo-hydrolase [Kiritimatiellia bacterium]HRZ12359.1 MBL fold metallo-hydrolase [Kiritimatiellia bacterium]HSA17883.1 MBL fold metallo-hydrolase [Kiritimatiellia bacterium]